MAREEDMESNAKMIIEGKAQQQLKTERRDNKETAAREDAIQDD